MKENFLIDDSILQQEFIIGKIKFDCLFFERQITTKETLTAYFTANNFKV